jgi:LmbE family N-acetylglucosaminyl deacetylase
MDMTVAVFFGAHADDIELGAGGTCAKLCASGFEVHIVIATDESDAPWQ